MGLGKSKDDQCAAATCCRAFTAPMPRMALWGGHGWVQGLVAAMGGVVEKQRGILGGRRMLTFNVGRCRLVF